jgi:glyoxylase-like metal-dependent hydrolase (beta-lactamase superfamily II)
VGRAAAGPGPWIEVGDRVFTRRYRFFDQQIGAILTDDGPVVIDTRSTPGQAREILADLRALTALPPAAVVDTHHHFDHAFGNAVFRPAPIWGHVRCAERIRATTAAEVAEIAADEPRIAAGLAEVVLDPPDRTFDEAAMLAVGARTIELRHLGRGHTDDDIVIVVPDADVLFAGDLLENGAPPYFGDGYPLDWPATLRAIRPLVRGAVVPGHGAVADLAFLDRSIGEIDRIAELARRVAAAELSLDAAVAAAPYPAAAAREPIERGLAQARGELDPR